MMSGDTGLERLHEAHESGLHLLHKPVQPITLRAMVNRFLKTGHDEWEQGSARLSEPNNDYRFTSRIAAVFQLTARLV
jgi:hypothetical protein